MGTVVLFPQDCLPIPKSRQRGNCRDTFNGMWILFDSRSQPFDPPILYTDRARNSHTLHNVTGPMFTYRARSSFGLHPSQREFDRRKFKTKRPGDPKQCDTLSTSLTSNVAASQQTKGSSTWIPGLDIQKEMSLGINGSRTESCKILDSFLSDRKKRTGVYGPKGLFDANFTKVQEWHSGLQLQDSVASTSVEPVTREDSTEESYKPEDEMKANIVSQRRSCNDSLMLSKDLNQISAYKASTEQRPIHLHASSSISPKVGLANQTLMVHELENAPTRLSRASTDSQLVEHLINYRSQASLIPGSNVNAIARTSSMPLPERWAGPAYSTSPPPSSLPLPKFSFLGQKTNSLHVASSIEQQKGKIAMPQVLESVPKAPAHLHAEMKLDVAYATMSLRRMLKLDLS